MKGWMASACWLLWLVAAGLTGVASAATNVNDKHLNCDPSGKLPCPPLSTAPIVDFEPEPSVKRVRPPVHRLSKSYQEKYKLAVARMKALPESHPLSFTAQAAIHQAYCDGHYQYDDPTRHAFDVHESWIFGPWHRIYIYFYERALAELIGDKTFALPYWNWDAPDGMVIPPLFSDASGNNSLYDLYRNQANLDKLVDLDYGNNSRPVPIDFDGPKDDKYVEAVSSNLCTVYKQQIHSGEGARNFLGEKLIISDTNSTQISRTSPGTLEWMAHNTVHVWTGKDPNSAKDNSTCALGRDGHYNCMNDMGFLGSAGRDPLFYSHHANVDRLWHIWSTKLHRKGFSDPAWLDSSFVFYDGVRNPRRVRIKFRDVLDTKNLGYTYDAVAENKDLLQWMSCKLTSLVPQGKGGGGGGTPGKVPPVFPLTMKDGDVVEVPGVALPAAPPGPGQDRVLVIDRIEYNPAKENKFDVAINVPKELAAKVAPWYKEYAGSFAVVPSSVKGGGKLEGKVTLAIDLVLADIVGAVINITTVDVVIVPRTPHEIKLKHAPTIKNADMY